MPDLDAISAALIAARNAASGDAYRALDNTVEALMAHPHFKEKRKAALDELARIDGEYS